MEKTKSAISGFIKISALVLFLPHKTQHPLHAKLISYHSKKSAPEPVAGRQHNKTTLGIINFIIQKIGCSDLAVTV